MAAFDPLQTLATLPRPSHEVASTLRTSIFRNLKQIVRKFYDMRVLLLGASFAIGSVMSFDQEPGEAPRPEQARDNLLRSDERSRIARELHDSTFQLLVALQLDLGQLRRLGAPATEPLLDEMEQVLRDIQKSIREISSGHSDADDEARVRVARAFYSLAMPDRSVR